MQIIVNRNALVQAILESMNNNEEEYDPEFERINVFEDEPIKPVEMMSTQLAEELPPVDDPDYIPGSLDQLARSAYAISKEVPESQVEFFYRKLHKLLDIVLDREEEKNMKQESVRSIIKALVESNSRQSELLKVSAQKINQGLSDWNKEAEDLLSQDAFTDVTSDEILSMLASFVTGIGDNDEESTADLSHDEPYVSPHEDIESDMNDEEDSKDDSEEDDDFDDSEEDDDFDDTGEMADDHGEEWYRSIALDSVIDSILSKGKHLVHLRDDNGKVQTAPTLKMDDQGNITLRDEPMKVLASQSATVDIVSSALDDQDVRDSFNNLVSLISKSGDPNDSHAKKISYFFLIDGFREYLGSDDDPVDEETAAIMAANNMADNISKSLGIPKFGQEISDEMIKAADDLSSSDEETVQASSGAGSDILTREVSKSAMVDALRIVSDERKVKPSRAKKQMYDMDYVPTPEELAGIESARELAQIEKNMKSLTANADAFGYSAAGGLRQWINKFPLMAYTVLMGEEKGGKAFQGYQSLLSDYMLTLLDNFVDKVIPAIKQGIEEDNTTSDDNKLEINSLLDEISSDFEKMRESSLMSDEEEIDPDLLMGDFADGQISGAVLRNALNDLFRKEDLMQVSKYIEKEMIPFLEQSGLSKKAATKLAHMFNGRVKMVLATDLKKAAAGENVSKSVSNVYNLGIGYDEMASAQKKAAEILETWFNEDEAKKRRKAASSRGESSKFSRDKIKKSAEDKLKSLSDSNKEDERIMYLADLLDGAISSAESDASLEVELEKMKLPKSER